MTTTPEQIEAVARAIANDDDWWEDYTLYAERAIFAMRPFIRAEVLEEAAKAALGDEASATEYYRGRVHAAAAIRTLKEKP